mmetsp:Transcript_24250/g.59858  ORF Transcript_24250/g.59858 Transcript_24250/m.59858 type:complete len:260 (+) Transcript_24250:2700-3479(+)
MRAADCARGMYCWDVRSISSITASVRAASCATCAACFLSVSSVAMTESSSRMLPLTLDSAISRLSSNSRILTRNSPCSLSMSDRFLSTSGRSDLSTKFMHWFCRLDGVTVKLTKVTRLQRSGVNWAVGSRVERNMVKDGEKSISASPTLMSTRPPCLWVSWFSTGFSMGSTRSTSWTRSGVPNRRALSRFFMKDVSAKDVFISRFSAYSLMMKFVACPDGSMMRGYRMNLLSTMAFSVERSSAGSALAVHCSRSDGLDR